jgi:hypothetical protein
VPGQRGQQHLGSRVVGLAREREAQVVLDVVVAGVDARVSAGSFASWSTKVAYRSSTLPPLWQLPAPALNSVSPENRAGLSVWERRQMWHIVWPGVSRHSSSTVLPTLITSPALTPRSTPAMREPDWWCAITLAPVAATTAALPPVWSWCSCVLRICVICQPLSLAAARHFWWSSGSMARASPLSGQTMR